MFHVRYYQWVIHPERFRDGSLLGFVIRTLNYVRYRLELAIQRMTLKWLLKRGEVDRSKTTAYKAQFEADVAEELSRMHREALEISEDEPVLQESTTESTKKTRPVPIDEMAARYGSGPVRARRYARSRRHTSILVDDFGPPEE